MLVLGGGGDYALPPAYKLYPADFLAQWKQIAPNLDLRFTGPGRYLDAVEQVSGLPKVERLANPPAARLATPDLPVTRSGARLSWTSFWIQCPKVKAGYRHAEHSLESAEAAATVASLKAGFTYPVQPLYHAWLEMLLNMDRNTLWGAAGGMVFEHLRSWDVRDRFESVEAISARTQQAALRTLLGEGNCIGLFNPLNWRRTGPATIRLPAGTAAARLGLPGGTRRRGALPAGRSLDWRGDRGAGVGTRRRARRHSAAGEHRNRPLLRQDRPRKPGR